MMGMQVKVQREGLDLGVEAEEGEARGHAQEAAVQAGGVAPKQLSPQDGQLSTQAGCCSFVMQRGQAGAVP